ncbi:MAG: GGDEF domain-containing protein [Xanthomonadaceae bacterium]|nr:GGDEF domain-containing protein [Xanthomonadaceae bacterium]
MPAHRSRRVLHLLLFAATLISGPAVAAPAAGAAPAMSAAAMPSSTAFDALFKRLDVGDLTALSAVEQRKVVKQLEQLLPPGDAHRARLLDTQRCGLDYINNTQKGYAYADTHLADALAAHDDAAAIRFYYCRGGYLESLQTPRDALADFERGIDLARASGDDAMLASGLDARGSMYSLLGIYGKALADLLEARRLFTAQELDEAASQILQDIGITYRRLGYPDKAREYLDQAIAHEKRVGDSESLYISTLQLGYADQETGHYETALATQQRALELAAGTDNRTSIAAANLALASVLTDLHRYAEAQQALQKAADGFAATGDRSDMGMLAYERGRALAGLNDPHKALAEFAIAEKEFKISGNRRYQEILYRAQAKSLEATKLPAAALAAYKNYLSAHDAVDKERANQQAQMLREQFDTDRAKLENLRLKSEQAMKDRQVKALQRVRRWQQVAMGLLAILLGLLSLLAIRQLARLRNWKRMASLDALTGVANLRGVQQFANAAMRRARAQNEPLTVLAIDLDEFKRINDAFGHPAGDRVLREIARACAGALRDGDQLGRIGGEEFLAVLPGTLADHAVDVAERLRRRVETLEIPDLPEHLRVSISIGVAEMLPHDRDVATLIERADAALYRAKALGRNRVVSADAYERGAAAGAAAATGGDSAAR